MAESDHNYVSHPYEPTFTHANRIVRLQLMMSRRRYLKRRVWHDARKRGFLDRQK